MRVERYTDQQRDTWDNFVGRSKNATFLFYRDYMDYHRDRFADHSLMIYDDADHLIALLPANVNESILVSHGGLTYGGFLTDTHMKTPLMLQVFEAVLSFCRNQGLSALRYKAIPPIYHRIPAQEDLYALFLCGAQISDRSVMTVISAQERIALPKGRRYSVNKARKHNLTVCRSDGDLRAYWVLLEETLRERHQAHPVHTAAEIERLQANFPQHIQLYTCRDQGEMLAGVVIFESACVARTQYIAVSARGRELCALDLSLDYLLNEVFAHKPFFDFGTSTDPQSGKINGGLLEQKESFGGRAIVQDTYMIDLEHWIPDRIQQAVMS
jgi:Acetyltransferase (GNAT) domain